MEGHRALSIQLAKYLRFRAKREKTRCELTAEWFEMYLRAGVPFFFGIQVSCGFMECDAQNPKAFKAFFKDSPLPFAVKLINMGFNMEQVERITAFVRIEWLHGRLDRRESKKYPHCIQTVGRAMEYEKRK